MSPKSIYKVNKEIQAHHYKPRRTRQNARKSVFKGTPLPIEALRLNEDIQAIISAREALATVDPWNITDAATAEGRRFARDMMRSTDLLLKTWEGYARRKLRKEYLAV